MKSAASTAWESISAAAKSAWNGISGFFGGIWDAITGKTDSSTQQVNTSIKGKVFIQSMSVDVIQFIADAYRCLKY